MSKKIFISGIYVYSFETYEELEENIYGKNFKNYTEKQKKEERLDKIKYIANRKGIQVLSKGNISKELLDNISKIQYVYIDNPEFYYITLCKNNIIDIFEEYVDIETNKIKYVNILEKYNQMEDEIFKEMM